MWEQISYIYDKFGYLLMLDDICIEYLYENISCIYDKFGAKHI